MLPEGLNTPEKRTGMMAEYLFCIPDDATLFSILCSAGYESGFAAEDVMCYGKNT